MSPVDANPIPYSELSALFLDLGNTLVSMDFAWVRAELARRGLACEVEELQRAEAACRPLLSEYVARQTSTEGQDACVFHLRAVLEQLVHAMDARAEHLARELAPVLRPPGRSVRLWSWVLPNVEPALKILRNAGLQLVVVSNSDGSAEETLIKQGLRPYFAAVLDSHHVGCEKPDPRIFERALECVQAPAECTLHVGDLYDVDVVGARKAGLHALLIDPFDAWPDVDCERAKDLWTLTRRIVGGGDSLL